MQKSNSPKNSPDAYRFLAGTYSFWEYLCFGKQLQRARFEYWHELEEAENVLLLGDGNGRFSTHLLESLPDIKIWSLDASEAMLNEARRRRMRRSLSHRRISQIRTDVLAWNPEGQRFDAVVAQFFIDGFDPKDLRSIFQRISKVLPKNGKLLVAEFNVPIGSVPAAFKARITLWLLYKIFRLLTGLKPQKLTPHTTILGEYGFELRKTCLFSQDTIVSQVFEKSSG